MLRKLAGIRRRIERLEALRRKPDFVLVRPEAGETWEMAFTRMGLEWPPSPDDTITIKRAYGLEVGHE